MIKANLQDIVYWLAPAAAASMIFMATYSKNRVMPMLTDVTQLLSALTIVGTVAMALVKPWGHPFEVTAKGRATNNITVHWGVAVPFMLAAFATALGMLINLSPYSPLKIAPGYTLNVIWSVGSIAVLALTVHICIESPRPRLDERFVTNEPAVLVTENNHVLECVVRNLSVGGARLECSADWTGVTVGRITFLVDGIYVGFRSVAIRGGELAVRFDEDACTRRMMTAKLFTGGYHNEVPHVSPWNVVRTTAQAMLS